MVKAARIGSVYIIEEAIKQTSASTVTDVKEAVLSYCKTHPIPSEEALSYIKKEIRAIF